MEMTPATCGAAMEVPEMVLSDAGLPIHAEVMVEPPSWLSMEFTVYASVAEAGEKLHALALELPGPPLHLLQLRHLLRPLRPGLRHHLGVDRQPGVGQHHLRHLHGRPARRRRH